MSGIDKYHILIVLLVVFGMSFIVLHIRTYQNLYNSLKKRGAVGDDFAPDWISKIGSFGCMGNISRIKKEIGIAKLDDNESSQVRKSVISYNVGTLATFVAVCLMFWRIYGVSI